MRYTDEYIADVSGYVRNVEQGARAADEFGDKQQAAALAARRMALAANEAGDKAARAQRKAAEAARLYEHAAKEAADGAEKLARGEISASEAAKLGERAFKANERAAEAGARAMRELERADIAQAAAAMVSAKATDHQADQFRQLARTGVGSFRTLEKSGESAFKAIGSSGAGMAALIGAAIGALPAIGELVGGAIAAGVGGGLIALGMMATKSDKQVRDSLAKTKDYIQRGVKDISAPFKTVWMDVATESRHVWDAFSAHLKDDFEYLAPAASAFVKGFGQGLVNMRPGIDSLAKGFSAMLRSLAAGLPSALAAVGDGLKSIGDQLQKHPEDIADLINGFIKMGAATLKFVAYLMGVWHALREVGDAFANFGTNLAVVNQKILAHIPVLGAQEKAQLAAAKAARDHEGATRGMVTAATGLNAATQVATMRALEAAGQFGHESQLMQLASQSAKDLKNSLDALTGKEITAREAAINYGDAVHNMTTSLKENGRAHGFATEKGRSNERALDALAKAAQDNAVAMRNDGKSARQVADSMESARQRIIDTAVKMGYSRREAINLANKLMGVASAAKKVPKGHRINYPVGGNAVAQLQAITRWANIAATAMANALAQSMRLSSGGYVGWEGAKGFADGGYAHAGAQGYPVGGVVRGPGTGTSDSIPAWLSNGEYVINAAATAMWRPVLDAINYGKGRPAAVSRPGPSRPGGGGGMTVVINVGGSVISERNLVETVRRGLAQRSVWNPGNNGALVPRGV